MAGTPRIALVIPNYWDGDTILDTLRSVRETEPIEIIVVDDNSPDPTTSTKLRAYQDSGLISKLILNEENEGASEAINRGVRSTSARYICAFGNDDLFEPGALGALADALEADPGASFAVGDFEYFGARPGLRRSAPWDPWRALSRNAWTGAIFVRREVYLELGGLTSECVAQDWDFYLGLASHGHSGVVLPRTIYRYRIHERAARESDKARREYRAEARAVRRRHADLFARERELRRASSAGIAEKLFWTLMIRIAPHRPPFLTDLYFHVTTMLAKLQSALRRRGSGALNG